MLTVVILNWARPFYVSMNLERYASYDIVKQVVCFNNGPPLERTRALPRKCVLIESSKDLGLYSRLAAASLATTSAIFHTDDDIGVPEATINELFGFWRRAQSSCHGLHGRLVHPVYQTSDVFGPVEVVLTRALICSRQVNNAALYAAGLFDDLNPVPRGNGEDIILSFAAMAISRSLNFAYRLEAENYPVGEEHAIHRRWRDHFKHRQQVVSRCRQIYALR